MSVMKKSRVDVAVFPVAGRGTRFLPATKASPKEMLRGLGVYHGKRGWGVSVEFDVRRGRSASSSSAKGIAELSRPTAAPISRIRASGSPKPGTGRSRLAFGP